MYRSRIIFEAAIALQPFTTDEADALHRKII
jgi:hypothetical protein